MMDRHDHLLIVLCFAGIIGAITAVAVGILDPKPFKTLRRGTMNPLMSALGTIAAVLAGAIISWMVKNNLVPTSVPIDTLTAALVTLIAAILASLLIVVKAYMSRLQAHMGAVNASGVVKSVAADAPAAMLAAPPTPAAAKIAAVNAIDGVKVVAQTAPAQQVDTPPPITK